MYSSFGFGVFQVNGLSLGGVNPLQDAKLEELFERLFGKDNSVEETGTHIRKHFLYNLCSERIVKVFQKGRKGINARGKINGKHLEFSKYYYHNILIFGLNFVKPLIGSSRRYCS